MSRLIPEEVNGLMEAYGAIYTPQELTEEQVWEEVENWVNSLLEEGYDLSDYTWEEMYESYLEEQGRSTTRPTFQNTGGYGKYSSPEAQRAAITQSARDKMFKAGGGNAAVRQSGRQNVRGGGSVIRSQERERIEQQGFRNLMQQRQKAQAGPAAPPASTTPPSTRPPAPAPSNRTPAPAPARPTAPATEKPTSTTPAASQPASAPAATPARPSLRSDVADLQAMRARSQVRQGLNPSTGNTSADIRARAARASVNSSFDPFDVIKGHLLDEGYADTEESALAIMANMSEDWKKSIVEAREASHNPEKYEEEQRKKKSKRQRAMEDPHTGINSPAFREFMRKMGQG